MNLRASSLAFLSAFVVVGGTACGEFDPQDSLTVSQGIYGVTTITEDVCPSGCDTDPIQMQLTVRVLPAETEVATVKSDDDGFYEVALEPGDYRICTAFHRCTDFSVGADELVRLDYDMAGPGWSR